MKKHWISLAYFMALATIIPLRAQTGENLVYNSSFEEYRHCPTKIDAMGVMREADAWWQPTGGSSDYFNACGSRDCTVPRNKMGYQPIMLKKWREDNLLVPVKLGDSRNSAVWYSLTDIKELILTLQTHNLMLKR